jgi:hypothetical protein
VGNVIVTNTSKEDFEDMVNGEVFKFPPKVPVTVPALVAHHIFGFGETDKEPWVIRLGWTLTRKDLPEALARLAKFKIDDPEGTRHSLSPVVERVPLDSPKGTSGGKLAIAPSAA